MTSTSLTEIRHALRRSRIRTAIMIALLRLEEAYVADLARVAGIEPKRVRAALYGDGRDYKRRDALVVLGLVRARTTDGRVFFAHTPRGARVAIALEREMLRGMLARPRART